MQRKKIQYSKKKYNTVKKPKTKKIYTKINI